MSFVILVVESDGFVNGFPADGAGVASEAELGEALGAEGMAAGNANHGGLPLQADPAHAGPGGSVFNVMLLMGTCRFHLEWVKVVPLSRWLGGAGAGLVRVGSVGAGLARVGWAAPGETGGRDNWGTT